MKRALLILAAACAACTSHRGAAERGVDAPVPTLTAGDASAREVGSSIAAVSTADLANRPATSIENALRGRVAGLSVLSNSGQPGVGASMRLRGNHSVLQGSRPLIYIDGVRVYSGFGPTTGGSMQAGSPLNDIDPGQIERIEILKGPAATTLYGTEAADGVIRIFTKQGSGGGIDGDGSVRPPATQTTP